MNKDLVARVQSVIPDISHPDILFLSNGLTEIKIPVTLMNDGGKVWQADVVTFGAGRQLNKVALDAVLADLDMREIKLQWDAVTFTNPDAPWPRHEIEWTPDPLSTYVRAARGNSFENNVRFCYGLFDQALLRKDDPQKVKELIDEGALRMVAAVLALNISVEPKPMSATSQQKPPSKIRRWLGL